MKNLLTILMLSSLTISCSKNDVTNFETAESIIFGQIAGECAGDCRNLLFLTAQGIYPDNDTDTEYGSWEKTSFKNEALPNPKFQLAKPLLNIPSGLLENEVPIAIDIVADIDYFIHIEQNGKSKIWIFDEIREDTPKPIKDYFNTLIQIYSELNN